MKFCKTLICCIVFSSFFLPVFRFCLTDMDAYLIFIRPAILANPPYTRAGVEEKYDIPVVLDYVKNNRCHRPSPSHKHRFCRFYNIASTSALLAV